MSSAISGLQRSFNNINISKKVWGGFSAVLAILLAVAAIGYTGFVGIGEEVEDLTTYVEEATSAARVESEFLALETHVLSFINGNEREAAVVAEMGQALRADLAAFEAKLRYPDHKQKAQELSTKFDAFMASFEQAEKLDREFKVLVHERLEPAGIRIIERLDSLAKDPTADIQKNAREYALEAREHALLARLYSNILIGRQDDSFGVKAEQEFEKFSKALDGLAAVAQTASERSVHADLTTLLDEYRQAFEQAAKNEMAIRQIVNGDILTMAKTITDDAKWIQTEATKAEKKIKQETMSHITLIEMEMLVISLIGICLGVGFGLVIGRAISKPVTGMTEAMIALAAGDHSVEIPARDRNDEIGRMANAVQVFKENMIRNEEMQAAQEEERRIKEARAEKIMKRTQDFDNMVAGVLSNVSAASLQMETTAQKMSANATQTCQQAGAVAAASEEASANVQTVASAAEELAASISEINRQVSKSSLATTNAVQEVRDTEKQVQGLMETSQSIGQVIELINDIAEQTNLLALNATIEAARAGDAGKGFAVVASEVKNLARQTAKATEQISTQIKSVQGATETAVGAIEKIGHTIEDIHQISSAISAAVEEQGAATQEIARNVEEAASGTQEVSVNIISVNQASGEAGEAANDVLAAAHSLTMQSSQLQSEVETFIEEMRCA